jgi:DNA (cytosine-5)-methyltransferase 3A
MIKLLLGGSPCTNWSIAKTEGRETEPSGIGWELFKNYIIAKEKFNPDFFLYENVASAFNVLGAIQMEETCPELNDVEARKSNEI